MKGLLYLLFAVNSGKRSIKFRYCSVLVKNLRATDQFKPDVFLIITAQLDTFEMFYIMYLRCGLLNRVVTFGISFCIK